ncbi:MAG: hypothetical protein K8F25_11345 [Fimbriimonadaceae bacterium]|nr:hypothetical protein [Alphaproteobacteria bacterium]
MSMKDCALKPRGGGRRLLQWTGMAVAFSLLAGCGTGNRVVSNTSDTFKGLYSVLLGKDSQDDEPQRDSLDQADQEPAAPDIQCPKTVVLPGTSHLVIYPRGVDPNIRNVQYQGTITNTARECNFDNPAVHIKFGFSGRVLLGPRGTPGQIVLPVRASLIKRDTSVAWTQTYQIPVQVTQNSRAEHFVKIEDSLDYEVPPGEKIYDYQIVIGFEQDERSNN